MYLLNKYNQSNQSKNLSLSLSLSVKNERSQDRCWLGVKKGFRIEKICQLHKWSNSQFCEKKLYNSDKSYIYMTGGLLKLNHNINLSV